MSATNDNYFEVTGVSGCDTYATRMLFAKRLHRGQPLQEGTLSDDARRVLRWLRESLPSGTYQALVTQIDAHRWAAKARDCLTGTCYLCNAATVPSMADLSTPLRFCTDCLTKLATEISR